MELGERGQAFYDAYDGDQLPAGHRAIVQEAARQLDTLDRLAALAAGDVGAWATLNWDESGEVTLSIDGVVAERRQQQLAFKQLMGEIRQLGLKQQSPGKPKDEAATESDDNDEPGAIILKLQQRAAR